MGYRVFRAVVLAIALLTSIAFGAAAQTSSAAATPALPAIAPLADKLLTGACQALASAEAFTFHAETLFDQALAHDVKVEFAGVMDFALQRPAELAVDYKSDLGSKMLWFQNETLTILDPSRGVYSTIDMDR
jgi:hypothetical protein